MKYSYVPESVAGDAAYDPFAVTREPFPAPEVTSRTPGVMPKIPPNPVLALAELAREQSWEVRTQYSRGNVPHAITGRPGALRELIGIRFGQHPRTDRQAYAVYSRAVTGSAWSWTSTMIWGPDLPPYAGCGITEIKAYLIMCADSSAEGLASWVADLKDITQNGLILKRRRDEGRKMILRLASEGWQFGKICQTVQDTHTQDEVRKILDSRKNTDREGLR